MSVFFYDRSAENIFVPTRDTVGPWDPNLQHGGPPAALLATLLDRASFREGSRLAYFSLDFYSPAPVAPMQIEIEALRPGKKISLTQALVKVDGRVVLRANAWRAATQADKNPARQLDEKSPPRPEHEATTYFPDVPAFAYARAIEWRFAENGFDALGPSTVWTRLKGEIIRGEAPNEFARVLAMVDSANGISRELPMGKFLAVPVNLTVSFTRTPKGEWFGMRAKTRLSSEGVGTCRAELFDDEGFLGEALQTLFVEPR